MKENMLQPKIHNLTITITYLKCWWDAEFRVQKHLLNWHSLTRVLLALLAAILTCTCTPRSPPVPEIPHPHQALPPATLGLFQPAAFFTVLELTCEQLFFQSIMSTVEALCVVKKRATCQKCDVKSPLLCVTVSGEILGQVIVVCECWHVLHCKWLLVLQC